jgi:hypothetical protein
MLSNQRVVTHFESFTRFGVIPDDFVKLVNWKAQPNPEATDPFLRANQMRGMSWSLKISKDEYEGFKFKIGNLTTVATKINSATYQLKEDPYTGGANPVLFECSNL